MRKSKEDSFQYSETERHPAWEGTGGQCSIVRS